MASDHHSGDDLREQAKVSVISTDSSDNELEETLSKASAYQLKLQREQNRHKEDMHGRDKGAIGRFFGNQSNAASVAAILTLIVGLIGAFCSGYFSTPVDTVIMDHNDKVFERWLAICSASLAFLFGKSSSE